MGRGTGQECTGWIGTTSVLTPAPHQANSASSARDPACGLHITSTVLAGWATFAPLSVHLARGQTLTVGKERKLAWPQV